MKALLVRAFGFIICMVAAGCVAPPDFFDAERLLVFAPDVALAEATGQAVKRINTASGLELRVASGGIRVRMSPTPLIDADGAEVCAWTPKHGHKHKTRWSVTELEIVVSPRLGLIESRCGELQAVLLHEMIHVLRAFIVDDYVSMGHTETGIFREHMGDPVIDSASLIAICEDQPCTTFEPERADETFEQAAEDVRHGRAEAGSP